MFLKQKVHLWQSSFSELKEAFNHHGSSSFKGGFKLEFFFRLIVGYKSKFLLNIITRSSAHLPALDCKIQRMLQYVMGCRQIFAAIEENYPTQPRYLSRMVILMPHNPDICLIALPRCDSLLSKKIYFRLNGHFFCEILILS